MELKRDDEKLKPKKRVKEKLKIEKRKVEGKNATAI